MNEQEEITCTICGLSYGDCMCGFKQFDETTLYQANNSKVLLSEPAKVGVTCPFCGSIAYTLAPYNVMIGFKLKQSKGE